MRDSMRIDYFANYQWILRCIHGKELEIRQTRNRINEGLVTRDSLSLEWEKEMNAEINALRKKLKQIEFVAKSMPETPDYIPCKLYIRLYYISGYTLTETAQSMNISESTLRRIRIRACKYFERYPPEKDVTF